ncbi:hypothetical protein NDU88_003822 [Pleurodeles waltl]|uniref:Uncharacterized protein n=1 Tax=Pleurodeles waltl TaxID=8319 RepID=A0AAV7RG97_PLEWA|nr:hypothetical protein NDU88_003822 [Pleurodeles waltl]
MPGAQQFGAGARGLPGRPAERSAPSAEARQPPVEEKSLPGSTSGPDWGFLGHMRWRAYRGRPALPQAASRGQCHGQGPGAAITSGVVARATWCSRALGAAVACACPEAKRSHLAAGGGLASGVGAGGRTGWR